MSEQNRNEFERLAALDEELEQEKQNNLNWRDEHWNA